MSGTCEPVRVASRIAAMIARAVGDHEDLQVCRQVAEREIDRYNIGPRDDQRQEIWGLVGAQLRGLL